MRSLLTAIAALAIATPAWAINAQEIKAQYAALDLCEQTGTWSAICYMRHIGDEAHQVGLAGVFLKQCDNSPLIERYGSYCRAVHAYIKQRWGY